MSTTTSCFQIYPDYYNSLEDCESFNKNYNKQSSNLRYKNFIQINFTAGDEEQFETYRYNKNSVENNVTIGTDNIFGNEETINIWNKFKNINVLSISNTFKYIFYKFKKGIFVKIIDNKLKVFLPFSNVNFVNEWHDNINIDPKYKTIYDYFEYICKLEGRSFNEKSLNKFINGWYSNNCLIRYEYPINECDTNVSTIKNMLEELCKYRKIPNIEFFINRRDYPIITKNGFEAYYHLWNTHEKPLLSHNYEKYAPILSMSNSENFADILMPTYEDWIRIKNSENIWFPKNRQTYDDKIFNIKWENKKSIAVFRGSSTGEGVTIETNNRLKLAFISSLNFIDDDGLPYLNAGITKWNFRPKKIINEPYLQNIDNNNIPFSLVSKLTPLEQSEYKYIIHIDGNVTAFRLSYELSMLSVILLVKSQWKCWFSNLLKPYVHYVPIKEDLSDLIQQIKWCKDNDNQCKIIANNAKKFYDKYLKKDGILDYFQKVLIDIKNQIGEYYYNEKTIFDIQFDIKNNYFLERKLKYPNTKNNINNLISFPEISRSYGLLKGIEFILNMVLEKNSFNSKVNYIDTIFNNKLGVVKKYRLLNYNFAIKSTNIFNKIKEHIHEAFIGINVINNLIKDIPNFVYVFGCYKSDNKDTVNIITEFISNETLQTYIMSKKFIFSDFINILLQICLALEVAQENIILYIMI